MDKFIKLTLAHNMRFDKEKRIWEKHYDYPETVYIVKDMINQIKPQPLECSYITDVEYFNELTTVQHPATQVYFISMSEARHSIIVLESPEYIMYELNKDRL